MEHTAQAKLRRIETLPSMTLTVHRDSLHDEEIEWDDSAACPHPILSRVRDEGALFFQRNRLWLRCIKGVKREEVSLAGRCFRLRFYSLPPSQRHGTPIQLGIYHGETFEVFGIFVTKRFVTAEIRKPTASNATGTLTAYVNIAKRSGPLTRVWAEIADMAGISDITPDPVSSSSTTYEFVPNMRSRALLLSNVLSQNFNQPW